MASLVTDLLAGDAIGTCGTWQSSYAELHHNIVSGNYSGGYLAHVCDAGVADCMVGLASVLYLAVLSGRAVLAGNTANKAYRNGEMSSRLLVSFDQPYVNWTIPPELAERYKDNPKYYFKENATWIQHFRYHNLAGVLEAEPDWLWIPSNAGLLHSLFLNPHHKAQLHRMGLGLHNAFECALAFLFRLNHETLQVISPVVEQFHMEDPRVIRIGMHVRMGDKVLLIKNEKKRDGRAERMLDKGILEPYMRCAEQVEQAVMFDGSTTGDSDSLQASLGGPEEGGGANGSSDLAENASGKSDQVHHSRLLRHTEVLEETPAMSAAAIGETAPHEAELVHQQQQPFKVLWYVLSDSTAVRERVRSLLPLGKVVTYTDEPVMHHGRVKGVSSSGGGSSDGGGGSGDGEAGGDESAARDRGLRLAVAEYFTFASLTDYQVVGRHSGYGRTAALRRGSNIYSTYFVDPGCREGGCCAGNPEQGDALWQAGTLGAGM